MRALRYHGIRDLRLEEVPAPVAGAGELLLRVSVVGVCGTDAEWMREAVGAEVLEKYPDGSVVFYNRSGAPWPVSDRDVVLRGGSGAARDLAAAKVDTGNLRQQAIARYTQVMLQLTEVVLLDYQYFLAVELPAQPNPGKQPALTGERSVESLSKLVHEACGLALVGAKESGVEVSYQIDPHLDRVLVDRIQIQQVLVNLVRNALDAMHGTARRQLLVSTLIDDDMAVVSVADTGPGLEPSVEEKLFQPFVTTKANGMGVGLSISRTIVEAHGGRIWTEANPGGGVIFRFSVRLAPEVESVQ